MIEPFYQWPRQGCARTADRRLELLFELAKIRLLVKRRCAGSRVKLAVERPKNLTRAVAAVREIKEVAPDFAAAAVERQGIAADPARSLVALGPVGENAAPSISVGGEEILIGDGAEFIWSEGKLPVLVDNLECEALAFGDIPGQADVFVAGWAIDIDPWINPVTSQQRQDEPRVVSARERASHLATTVEKYWSRICMLRSTVASNGAVETVLGVWSGSRRISRRLSPTVIVAFTGASSTSSNTVASPETTPLKTYSHAPCAPSVTRSSADATAKNDDEAIR